jgi:L-lactate dehydrogenase complex protein LldF
MCITRHGGGGEPHHCRYLPQARRRTVTKGKSMVGEETGLNAFLEANGLVPIETDLGEYIIQLAHELPSHIIMPAVHLRKAQIEADFRRVTRPAEGSQSR